MYKVLYNISKAGSVIKTLPAFIFKLTLIRL